MAASRKLKILTPEERKARLRRRWRLFWVAFAIVFTASVLVSQSELGERVAALHEFCQNLRKGYPLAAVRQEALERGLLYELDPDPSGFRDDTGYVVRPTPAWPRRYGCRLWASRGVLTEIQR